MSTATCKGTTHPVASTSEEPRHATFHLVLADQFTSQQITNHRSRMTPHSRSVVLLVLRGTRRGQRGDLDRG
jgi:hypothetical protein